MGFYMEMKKKLLEVDSRLGCVRAFQAEFNQGGLRR